MFSPPCHYITFFSVEHRCEFMIFFPPSVMKVHEAAKKWSVQLVHQIPSLLYEKNRFKFTLAQIVLTNCLIQFNQSKWLVHESILSSTHWLNLVSVINSSLEIKIISIIWILTDNLIFSPHLSMVQFQWASLKVYKTFYCALA